VVLPIGDAPNPRGVPIVTYLLIAANVAVYLFVSIPLGAQRPSSNDPALHEYLRVMAEAVRDPAALHRLAAQVTDYDLFVFQWGFRPAAPSLADLFTSMFLHGGFLHLFGNMLFLWIYGDNVEHRLGSGAFLFWYLATGAAATLFHMLGAAGSAIPLVGASGAISGVLGFYFLWFPRNSVRLLWLLPPFLMQVFEVPARLVLGMYLVVDNVLPYLVARSEVGVAHGAHIGGFVAGLAVAWVMGRRELSARPAEFADAATVSLRREPEWTARIARAIDGGRMEEAAAEYFEVPAHASRGILTPERSLALARWLREHGHDQAALVVARRHLRDFPGGPGAAAARVVAGEALLASGQATPAYQYFLDALDAEPDPATATAARRGVAAVQALQKRQIGRPHRGGDRR
jgi:membrane associated rhomboid family serine protease